MTPDVLERLSGRRLAEDRSRLAHDPEACAYFAKLRKGTTREDIARRSAGP